MYIYTFATRLLCPRHSRHSARLSRLDTLHYCLTRHSALLSHSTLSTAVSLDTRHCSHSTLCLAVPTIGTTVSLDTPTPGRVA